MRLLFNINYRTAPGEALAVNITEGSVAPSQTIMMSTHDGCNWTGTADVEPTQTEHLSYHYSVVADGKTVRQEWLVAPHRLHLTSPEADTLTAYDSWIDIPEDSYLYSSAITDCICGRQRTTPRSIRSKQTLQLKVRAPQLRRGERLALLGNDARLGQWTALKAVPMNETQPNEWIVCIDATKLATRELEFKFVILDEEKDVTPLWEGGHNRQLTVPQMRNGEMVVYELPEALFPIYAWKGAGTVIPVFSLRSEGSYGVGDFGDLMLMTDWAAATRQQILQILPINDTTISHTWVDSYPYKCISIYALHPQYCDLRQLAELKDTARRDHYEQLRQELNALPQIDYERVNDAKLGYLRELYQQTGRTTLSKKAFATFFERNEEWLVPYAAFCYWRDQYGTATFSQWPAHQQWGDEEKRLITGATGKMRKEIQFWYYVQYLLDEQLRRARDHAHRRHVILKGDIPIGVSRDSVEAWVEPDYFNMNGQAGAPPDAFSVNGQNWGFPTYNWDTMLADGCSWWARRFRKMAEYFDAYRIDHVLGFFRIWEIPSDAVHGLLGQFSPALGMTREEIAGYGLNFQEARFTEPFITDWVLDRIFHDKAQYVKEHFLERTDQERYHMKPEYDTQRKVEKFFETRESADINMRDGLYALISDVLFLRDRKNPELFHPRVGVQLDFIYESLYDCDKEAFNRLYNEYFYHRNSHFWYGEAMKKLEQLTQATRMLVCAEDLGMVPDCVPWVMNQLRILTLEIQTMPKDDKLRFGRLSLNPYRSVCTFSTHDMPTLRQWWDEDMRQTQEYYNTRLYRDGGAPHPLPGWLAKEIVSRHLKCPSMLCLLSLQDWLSIDERLRLPDQDAERINIPANPKHYWRYRMHLTIEQLMREETFNNTLSNMIWDSGRI